MSLITSFINPALALGTIRKQLEKNTGLKVTDYEIHFDPKKDNLFFVIDKSQYQFEKGLIIDVLKSQIKQYEKKTTNLYYMKLVYSEVELYILIYYIENEQKKFIKHVLK